LLIQETQLLPTILFSIALILFLSQSLFQLQVFSLHAFESFCQLGAFFGGMCALGLCLFQHFFEPESEEEYF
jgi:predicted permease